MAFNAVYSQVGSMPRRRRRTMLSNNGVADLLEVSREEVLRIELTDDSFPRHSIIGGYLRWDQDEIVQWAEEGDWFDEESQNDMFDDEETDDR